MSLVMLEKLPVWMELDSELTTDEKASASTAELGMQRRSMVSEVS